MSSYLTQIKPLTITRNLLNLSCFGIDDSNIIDCLMPKTGWQSTVVYECLKEYDQLSIVKLGFDDKIYSLRTHLHHHLDKRIYLLTHLSEINVNKSLLFESTKTQHKIGRDPWLVEIQCQGVDKDALIAASLHIRDILFTAHEIETVIPEKAEQFLNELNLFNQKLPSYLNLLKNLSLDESKEIKKVFDRLYELMENNQLTELSDHLSHIRQTLRHSGVKNFPAGPPLKEQA